jgi:osmoprotectant transport system ATP-binding protein
MSQGRLLQYDRPAVLLTRPADPFVARMTGSADRALRLLSLRTAGEVATPGMPAALKIGATATLRDALAELIWHGAEAASVVGSDGAIVGRVTIAALLAAGQRA